MISYFGLESLGIAGGNGSAGYTISSLNFAVGGAGGNSYLGSSGGNVCNPYIAGTNAPANSGCGGSGGTGGNTQGSGGSGLCIIEYQ